MQLIHATSESGEQFLNTMSIRTFRTRHIITHTTIEFIHDIGLCLIILYWSAFFGVITTKGLLSTTCECRCAGGTVAGGNIPALAYKITFSEIYDIISSRGEQSFDFLQHSTKLFTNCVSNSILLFRLGLETIFRIPLQSRCFNLFNNIQTNT